MEDKLITYLHLQELTEQTKELISQVAKAAALAIKNVQNTVPKNVSELNNDAEYQTDAEVKKLVDAAINAFATDMSDDGVVDTFKELVDYVAEHGGEAADLAKAIEDLSKLVGNTSVSDQIAEALTRAVSGLEKKIPKKTSELQNDSDFTALSGEEYELLNQALAEA